MQRRGNKAELGTYHKSKFVGGFVKVLEEEQDEEEV